MKYWYASNAILKKRLKIDFWIIFLLLKKERTKIYTSSSLDSMIRLYSYPLLRMVPVSWERKENLIGHWESIDKDTKRIIVKYDKIYTHLEELNLLNY